MDALAPQARDAGVAFEADLGPRGESLVVGDRDQIVQVAQNLVGKTVDTILNNGQADVVSVGFLISLWAGSSATATGRPPSTG